MKTRAGMAIWPLSREHFAEPEPGEQLKLATVQSTACWRAGLFQWVVENTALHRVPAQHKLPVPRAKCWIKSEWQSSVWSPLEHTGVLEISLMTCQSRRSLTSTMQSQNPYSPWRYLSMTFRSSVVWRRVVMTCRRSGQTTLNQILTLLFSNCRILWLLPILHAHARAHTHMNTKYFYQPLIQQTFKSQRTQKWRRCLSLIILLKWWQHSFIKLLLCSQIY